MVVDTTSIVLLRRVAVWKPWSAFYRTNSSAMVLTSSPNLNTNVCTSTSTGEPQTHHHILSRRVCRVVVAPSYRSSRHQAMLRSVRLFVRPSVRFSDSSHSLYAHVAVSNSFERGQHGKRCRIQMLYRIAARHVFMKRMILQFVFASLLQNYISVGSAIFTPLTGDQHRQTDRQTNHAISRYL